MIDDFSNRLKPTLLPTIEPRSTFFDLSLSNQKKDLSHLLEEGKPIIIDTYEQQLKELFVIRNPWLNLDPDRRDKEFATYRDAHYVGEESWQVGKWVYLSWRNLLLHLLSDEDYQEVRTGRNRNLITKEEQQKYYHSTIGIAGLSVGNSCALAIVLTGGGKRMRLADPDSLELTNLNRIRSSVAELTAPKVYMTARQIYELDPYAKLELYAEGLIEENIQQFFDGPPKLDIIIDEMDNLGMKVRLRQEAQRRGIPVVMAADNGDGGILDIERHDQQKDILPFHGRAGKDIAERVVNKKLPLPIIGQIITEDIIGADIVTPRMQESLLGIGKTVASWPQLGAAATLNGSIIAAVVRRILNGQPVSDDRVVFAVEGLVDPTYQSEESVHQRAVATREFLEKYRQSIVMALGTKPE